MGSEMCIRDRDKRGPNLLLTQHFHIGIDGYKHKHNTNILIVGGSGAGKTRTYGVPNVLECACSMVITDPKAEILRKTGNLLKQKGYDVTQATVSRDINELNIEKTVSSNGVNCYAKAEKVHTVKFHNIISEAVVNIDYAMNIVSIKCHSGLANAACAGLDMMNLSYVVGTIAGDDTIFVLTRTEGDARMLTRHLKELL